MATNISRNKFSPILPSEVGFRKYIYRDVSPRFIFHPLTGDIVTVTDFNSVANSIKMIIMTEKNSRHFSQIDFGVGVEKYLFELMTPEIAEEMVEDITTQIGIHEPRAILHDVTVTPLREFNSLSVYIKFGIKTTSQTQEIKLILERS